MKEKGGDSVPTLKAGTNPYRKEAPDPLLLAAWLCEKLAQNQEVSVNMHDDKTLPSTQQTGRWTSMGKEENTRGHKCSKVPGSNRAVVAKSYKPLEGQPGS